MSRWLFVAAVLILAVSSARPQKPSPLDRYLEEAQKGASNRPEPSGGSLYLPSGPLGDLARDPRARLVNDIVTILVVEQATAESKGSTSSSRKSNVKAGVSSFYGNLPARFQNLANTSATSSLDGQGTTKRESTVTTRLSARVTHVLPNGYLVVEANKDVLVNSERQLVSVRGVVRPADLARDNTVRSDRLAELEIRINGKGVVNDAIKRPFILYRLLLGLLPF